jgi:ParB/RepB/Spo0J family partition protein
MAKKREPIDFGLPGIDDIFSTQAERDEAKLKKIYEIPLDQIDPFPEHPFKVKDDEDMMNLVESVKANGIITPATLRKKEDGRYEIISGHRRKRACELAGLETLRSEVVDMTRDEATIFMVESNFQRTTILPSEKAFAYKMRLEAMNRQGQRTDLTSTPLVSKSRSNEEIGKSTETVEIKVNDGKPIENKLIYGSVSGKKIDENGEALGGALIGIFKADETEYTKEHAIMTATSEKDGSFSFAKVPYGKWIVREIEAPEGFVLDDTSYEVNIGENEQVIEVEITDEYIHGNIELTKVDADYPDNKLTGATFDVYKDVNGDGKLDDGDELIGNLEETATGIYEMKELLYKNLYLYTKMRNVGGIAQTEAQKSSDLFMKCRYLDEITGGRGTVFATGTPISNSMVELYTIQRYLQYNTLVKNGLQHFDAWASTFGETVTAIELTPEGTGYRAKTRFAKFYNLPELMAMFKEVADIKTADMLNLPVPEAEYHNVSVEPSEMQKEMVASLAERAEKVRGGGVDSSVDNMLKITNDGRKLALDQRMLNAMLPDFENSKINACVDNVYRIWEENKDKKSAQLVFCDLSTPKNDGTFSVYNDIRKKLIERGVPESEVRFIHEADTDMKKKELFQKTRKGEVRVLLGSTQKMGAGTNVQERLIALHDVDCPWVRLEVA